MERRLAVASAAASSSDDGEGSERLSIQQMLGTFVLHYILTAISMVIAVISNIKKRYHERLKKQALKEAIEKREEEIEKRRIYEEEQIGKEPEGSPDVVNSIRRRVSSYNNMDSSAMHGQSALFRQSTRTPPGFVKQNTRTPPGLQLTTQQFAQVRELMNDESRVSVTEVGGGELVTNLLKQDKPRLQSKDARYLQLQLEQLQEGLANMQDFQAQMQWGIEERLQLQQDYMDQQMNLIVVLLQELKFQMPKNPQIPVVLPFARGIDSNNVNNVTGSTTMNDATGSTTMNNVTSSTTMNDVTGSTTMNNVACSATMKAVTGSTTMSNVTGSPTVNATRTEKMNLRVPRSSRIKSAGASSTHVTETTTVNSAGASSDDHGEEQEPEIDLSKPLDSEC
jgi:hypothetical protein